MFLLLSIAPMFEAASEQHTSDPHFKVLVLLKLLFLVVIQLALEWLLTHKPVKTGLLSDHGFERLSTIEPPESRRGASTQW